MIALKFTVSLRKNEQFGYVFKGGKSKGGKYLVVFILKNNSAQNRLGITVSKKMGKAVARNRQKRHIKEAYRALEFMVEKTGYDIIVLPKAPLISVKFLQVKDDLEKVLKKHGLIGSCPKEV